MPKKMVRMFPHNFLVPFYNNQAEHDARNMKARVSGCSRMEDGVRDYLDVISYLSTGMKHGVSVFDALTAAFASNGTIVLQ